MPEKTALLVARFSVTGRWKLYRQWHQTTVLMSIQC